MKKQGSFRIHIFSCSFYVDCGAAACTEQLRHTQNLQNTDSDRCRTRVGARCKVETCRACLGRRGKCIGSISLVSIDWYGLQATGRPFPSTLQSPAPAFHAGHPVHAGDAGESRRRVCAVLSIVPYRASAGGIPARVGLVSTHSLKISKFGATSRLSCIVLCAAHGWETETMW